MIAFCNGVRWRAPAAAFAGAATAVCLTLPPQVWACSTCKCGDYTISLMGTEKPYENRVRAAVDLLLRSESQGEPGVDERQTHERRLLFGLAWSPSEDLTLAAQIPYVHKRIEDYDLARQQAEGLGDVDLIARWTAWKSVAGGASPRQLAGLRLGLRLPTAEQVRVDGELLDIDVQPDAGSPAPNLGLWYGYYRFPWFLSVSATGFAYGDGHQQFEPGNAGLLSVLGQWAWTQDLALQAGIDARQSQRNAFSGIDDPDSGGFLAMASAGVAWRVREDWLLNAAVSTPVIEQLNGVQHEDTSLRLGLTYDF